MKSCSLLVLFGLLFSSLFAQKTEEEPQARPVTNILSLGVGRSGVRNTYLTPLLYTGPNLSLEYQRWRMQRNLSWVNWQMVDAAFTSASDKGENSDDYSGRFRYRYGVLHKWSFGDDNPNARWSFYLGPYMGFDLGFDYNLKMASANNPATARITGNVGAMGAVSYGFYPHGLHLPVMLQFRTPFLGGAFMPEYGASYYETFYLENSGSKGHFTSLHNQQDLDVELTTDVPFALIPWFRNFDSVIRLGASYHIETLDINDITTRYSSFEFVVGWVYQQIPYGHHKSKLLKRSSYEAY